MTMHPFDFGLIVCHIKLVFVISKTEVGSERTENGVSVRGEVSGIWRKQRSYMNFVIIIIIPLRLHVLFLIAKLSAKTFYLLSTISFHAMRHASLDGVITLRQWS